MSAAIGALRARVTLQSPVRSADDLGGGAISFVDEGDVWAEVRAGGAGAGADYDTATSESSYELEIRALADVRAGWRVVWGVRTFRVEGVRDAGGARITLICAEEKL